MANRKNKPTVASRGQQNHAATAGGPSDPQCGSCYGYLCSRRYESRRGRGGLVPRKGTAKMENDVWGKRCLSQRMVSKAVLDIPITKAKGYQSVMMIKVLLNKLCQSPMSAR